MVKLSLDGIVDAGMTVFAEVGYQGLSMRRVADRLSVHAGSLYYHVKNKEALVALLADRVANQAYAAGTAALTELGPDVTWEQQVMAQMSSLRGSIRAHPGGPALLASSPRALSSGALSLMERLLRTLQLAGAAAAAAFVAADTMLSYVTGFVLQEQSERTAVEGAEVSDWAERFPLVVAAVSRSDVDDLFARSVDLLCSAVTPS